MSKTSYAKALNEALTPFGFHREGDDFIRIRGEIWQCVNRYSSWLGGVKVSLHVLNLGTSKLSLEILGNGLVAISESLGSLIDGRDRKWGDGAEYDGDAQAMVAAVLQYGLPWFDQAPASLEEQATRWYARETTPTHPFYHSKTMIALALTLYRMGEIDEARRVLDKPPRRLTPQSAIDEVARLRTWLDQASSEKSK